MHLCKRPAAFTAQAPLQPCLCPPTLLPSHPPERCGKRVLSGDGSLASTALPQASPARNSARNPLPLPRPHGLGQTSASRPPSFDQYRASSQDGCRLHPPRRPQAQPGSHGGGGCSLAQGLWGVGRGRAGESRKGRHHSQNHSFLHPLTRLPTYVQSTNI